MGWGGQRGKGPVIKQDVLSSRDSDKKRHGITFNVHNVEWRLDKKHHSKPYYETERR